MIMCALVCFCWPLCATGSFCVLFSATESPFCVDLCCSILCAFIFMLFISPRAFHVCRVRVCCVCRPVCVCVCAALCADLCSCLCVCVVSCVCSRYYEYNLYDTCFADNSLSPLQVSACVLCTVLGAGCWLLILHRVTSNTPINRNAASPATHL
jgi:hypothetical protein